MRRFILVAALAVLTACAQNTVQREAFELLDAGDIEGGLAKLEEASRLEPGNREYRQTYFRQREVALQRLAALAETARQHGHWDAAEAFYRRMLGIDSENQRGRAGIEAVRMDRRHRAQLAEAEELLNQGNPAAAQVRVRGVLAENGANREAQQLLRRIEERALRAAASAPALSAALRQPITLDFRDATLREVFEAITRSTGLNFIFDREVRQDQRTTIFVRNSAIEDVLRFVLVTNQLDRKVLSANTVLVYPNTPAKTRDYQDLVTKTFYVANADVKSTANMIRALVKTKDMYIDEKLNLLVIRDTPDAVRFAERLVGNQDLAEPEVMLEVEVLEVSSNSLTELGIRWPDSISFSLVGAAGTPGTITLPEWLNRSSELVRITVTDPLLALNFRQQLGRTNLLANPRIRVKNKEKAKVHIGDKVPVITTTTTATGFASESVSYLDIGLKLEVEPTVFLENEVGIRIGLEVSNIVREVRSATGTLTYQVGTRNASTALRLKDGETQVLAGLISDEDRKTINQVPGLGDLPVAGRLFGSHLDTSGKTEIVLLITPRVVRNLARPELRFEEFPSGTESAIGAPSLLLQTSATETPARPDATGARATGGARLALQAPPAVSAGQDFEVQLSLDSAQALRSGLLDIAFDATRLRFVRAEPGSIVIGADATAAFRANAPEGLGRLSLNFSAKAHLKGQGELARLRFQAVGSGPGLPTIRVEAASFVSAAGPVVSAQLPPPVSFAVER